MAQKATIIESTPSIMATEAMDVVKVAIVGLILGLIVPALGLVVARFFVEPVFCHSVELFDVCSTGGNFAFNIAVVLMALAGVGVLAWLRIYRPLLIAIGTAAALWGLKKYLDGMQTEWLLYYVWFGVLYALSYVLMYWLLRLRRFWVSVVLIAVVVGLSQWVLIAS